MQTNEFADTVVNSYVTPARVTWVISVLILASFIIGAAQVTTSLSLKAISTSLTDLQNKVEANTARGNSNFLYINNIERDADRDRQINAIRQQQIIDRLEEIKESL